MNLKYTHEYWMNYAYNLAYKAFRHNEIPIGAIIIRNNIIIGKGYNLVQSKCNTLAHAEIIALNKAIKFIKQKRLYNCILYVTLEPCIMCTGAILQNRISKIVFGTINKTLGGFGGKINILKLKGIYKNIEVIRNINQYKCSKLLIKFFKLLRKK